MAADIWLSYLRADHGSRVDGVDDVKGDAIAIGGVDRSFTFRAGVGGMEEAFGKNHDAFAAWNVPVADRQRPQRYKYGAGGRLVCLQSDVPQT
jgi:hypothetical protein